MLSKQGINYPYGFHLPIFPTLYHPSEDQIERVIERLYDRADKCLMSGKCTQEEYDAWTVALRAAEDRRFL